MKLKKPKESDKTEYRTKSKKKHVTSFLVGRFHATRKRENMLLKETGVYTLHKGKMRKKANEISAHSCPKETSKCRQYTTEELD